MYQVAKNLLLLGALTALLACPTATLQAAPTRQVGAPPMYGVELLRASLGDFGYIEYDSSFDKPNAEHYASLIRNLFNAFPSVDLHKVVIHWIRFRDYERKAVSLFGRDFERDFTHDMESAIIFGFNTRASLSEDLAEVYLYQLSDELVIHELLHHILHRLSPVPVKRYYPDEWPQTMMNNHNVLAETLRRFMGSPLYKNWLRRNQ